MDEGRNSHPNRNFRNTDKIQSQFGAARPNASQSLPGSSSLTDRLQQLPRLTSSFPPLNQSRPTSDPQPPNPNLPSMIAGAGASAPSFNPALPSPTSAALDYNTFWQLQQQYGVGGFRDNLNYAVAQNQGSVTLAPYQEPLYNYNGFTGYANPTPSSQAQQQQQQQFYYTPSSDQTQQTQDYQSPPGQIQDYYSPPQPQSQSIPTLAESNFPQQYTSPALTSDGTPPSTKYTSPPVQSASVPQPTTPSKPTKRKPTLKRKRARTRKDAVEDSSDSEDDDDNSTGRIGKGPDGKPVRLAGACTHCKKLKMKCEFESPMDVVCKRCRNTKHECIVEGRKPRTQPNKREFLLAQIRQKDQIIEKLLKQIHSPHHNIADPSDAPSDPSVNANPDVVAWIQQAQASVRAGQGPFVLDGRADRDTDEVGSEDESDIQSGIGNTNDSLDDFGLLSPNFNIRDPAEREKLHSLPNPTAPLGLIAKLSLDTSSNRSRSKSGSSVGQSTGSDKQGGSGENEDVGVANDDYFRPGPAADVDLRAALMFIQPPEILVHGLVSPQDVESLFQIFYQKLNPFLSLLDPKLHTPASTFSRCPFLFTVICAVSSRYYTAKSSIYPIAMHFAKSAAARNLVDGWKCVELSQAYMLMSLYAMPARKWEEDRSWLYLGLAIRVATDLNLHHPTAIKTQNELHEREILNRTRTWIILFNLDRSMSTQIGKPSTIREDYIIYKSDEWYAQSRYNSPCDIHLSYYAQLLRIVARFHDQVYNGPLGIRPEVNVHQLILDFDDELTGFQERTQYAFDEALKMNPENPDVIFRGQLTPFLVNYSKLVMYSFGFQKSFQAPGPVQQDDIFLDKCVRAGLTVLKVFVNALVPSGYMRYSPDGHFVFTSFACAFLIKLIRNDLVDESTRNNILEAIGEVISAMGSPDIAIDEKHTPKLYARFLQNLLAKQTMEETEPMYTESPSTNADTTTGSTTSTSGGDHTQTEELPEPYNPSISVEYAPLDGATHVQVLQRADGSAPRSFNFDGQHNHHHVYDERLSTTSSTIGGEHDTATQHTGDLEDDHPLQNGDMLATMHILNNPGFYDHMLMPPFNPPQWGHLTSAERYQHDAPFSSQTLSNHRDYATQNVYQSQ